MSLRTACIRTWQCALIVGMLCLVLAVYGYRYTCIRLPQAEFNAMKWKRPDSTRASHGLEPSARQTFIRDLINNILPGKQRGEIEELLAVSKTHADMRRHSEGGFPPSREG